MKGHMMLYYLKPRTAFAMVAAFVGFGGFSAAAVPGAASAAYVRLGPFAVPTPPYQNGDTFAYTVTRVTTIAFPSASPTTFTVTASENLTVSTGQTFHGHSGLYQFAYASQDSNGVTAMENDYYSFVAQRQVLQQRFEGSQQSATGPSGYSETSLELVDPAELLDELPHTLHRHWTVKSTVSYTESNEIPHSYVESIKSRTAGDGAYTQSYAYKLPGYSTKSEGRLNADGTGNSTLSSTGYNEQTDTFGAPVQMSGKFVIPVTNAGGNPRPATPSPPTLTDVPDWLPGHGAAPQPLQRDVLEIEASTVPGNCGSWVGQSALNRVETFNSVDPVGGSVSTYVTDSYDVAGVGYVCFLTTSAGELYDNIFSGTLLDTTSELVTTVLASSSRRRDHFGASVPALSPTVAAGWLRSTGSRIGRLPFVR